MNVVIYCIMLLLIPIAIVNQKQYKRRGMNKVRINWTLGLIGAFLSTVLIRGLAWDTGADWLAYYNSIVAYSRGYETNWAEHTEWLFRKTTKFLASLNLWHSTFFILVSALITYSLLKISSLYGKAQAYIIVFWYLVMFGLSLNIYRQYISLSFIYLCVWSIFNKKKVSAFLFLLLAVLFHTSALVAVPFGLLFYYMRHLKISVNVWILLIFVTTFITETFLNVFLEATAGFQRIFLLGNSNSYNVLEFRNSMYGTSYMWILMIVHSIIVFYSDKIKDKYKDYSFFHYAMVVTFILTPLCQQELLSRILLYSKLFVPIGLGVLIFHYNNKKVKLPLLLLSVSALAYLVMFIYYLNLMGQNHPYVIQFDKI